MKPASARHYARYRIVSLICLLVFALSAASWVAIQSAEAYETRGVSRDFQQPIFGAESLMLGVNAALDQYDEETLEARVSEMAQRGIRTVRQEFRWNDIERERGKFDWTTSDRIMDALRRHDMQVLPVLWTTPEWARAPTSSEQWPPIETMPPRDPKDFARFVKAFVERYDDGRLTTDDGGIVHNPSSIVGYQIWDEPNLSAAWGNALINPSFYLQMLWAARAAIHEVNPQARIVLAGLAPTTVQSDVNLAPQTYLLKLYQLGGHQAFDIAAAKVYGFDFPADDRRVDPGLLNFSHVILMRDVMVAHGEGHKAMWATPFGWNAVGENWQGEKSIWGATTEQSQAQNTRRAIQRAAHEWPWLGAMFIDGLQPRPRDKDPQRDAHWGFALVDQHGRPRPVYDAFTAALEEAALAPRAQLFADCKSPQSLLRTLRLENVMTAMPEVLASKLDCATPNPRATFTEGWRFDQLGADIPDHPDAKVTFRFNGDTLALIVRRGDYRAYTFVTVDGKPANLLPKESRGTYLIMTSPGLYPVIETIPVADNLGPGEHVAEVFVDRGWNQWALMGWSSTSIFDFRSQILDWVAVAVGVMSAIALVASAPRARWGQWFRERWAVINRQSSVINRPLTWQAILLGLITWLTASLTWAQDAATAYRNLGTAPQVVVTGLASGVLFWSPVFVLSLFALAALFVLVLLRVEIGLMLLAFFIPFYLIPQRLFARAFSMVELITLMCAISWVIRKLEIRDWRFGPQGLISNLQSLIPNLILFDWSILALVVISLLSASQADFRVEALREFRLVVVEPALVYLMLRTLSPQDARGRTWLFNVVDGYVLGAVAIAVIGLVNYALGNTVVAEFGLPRIKSVFGSPNNDALYLERAFPVLLAVVLWGKWRLEIGDWRFNLQSPISDPLVVRRTLYAIGLVPVTLALLLSQSRGALFLGVPAAVIVMCLLAGGRWRWLGAGMLAVMVLVFVVLLSGVAAPLLEGTRFANALDLSRGTGFFRLNLWQSALNMWRDHALLGVGPDNFLYAYRSFYILPAAWQEPNLSHPHNIVFDFATRLGTLGLLAGIGVIAGYVQLIRRTFKIQRVYAIAFAGFLATMLAHGLVDNAFFLVDLAFAFMLTAGVMACLSSSSPRVNEAGTPSRSRGEGS